jgi:hypothetical protein
MTQQIKAIETVYNGYRFRSRLEARWAVFFDALGLKYEYEKEGYDLGEAGWYLPDFWLPSLDAWWEIKPLEEYGYSGIVEALAVQSGKMAINSFGPPGSYKLSAYSGFDGMCYPGLQYMELAECRRCSNAYCLFYWDGEPFSGSNGWSDLGIHDVRCATMNDKAPSIEKSGLAPRLEYATRCAKQARFEHGETPRVIPWPGEPHN